MSAPRLPEGFTDLEPWLDSWGLPTTAERHAVRCNATMEEIRAFYDAMTARADEACDLIDSHPLDALPPPVSNLMALVLGLAQAHVAVEIHGTPRAPNTPWPNSLKIVRGLSMLG